MQIGLNDETGAKVLSFSPDPSTCVDLGITPTVEDFVERVSKLNDASKSAIVVDAGLAIAAGVDPTLIAQSIAQNAWYEATEGKVPEEVTRGHQQRVSQYLRKVEKVNRRTKRQDVLKGARHMAPRISDRAFQGVVADESRTLYLRGQRLIVYETTCEVSKTAPVSLDTILAAVQKRVNLKGADNGRHAVAYHLKELVTAGLVTLSPRQTEVPA